MNDDSAAPAIRIRLARILMGPPEEIYDPELIRQCALAIESGEKSIFLEVKQRLQGKFKKDFNTTRFNELVTEAKQAMRAKVAEENISTREGWELLLLRARAKDDFGDERTGPPLLCEHNGLLYLENHADWRDTLGYNAFTAEHAVLAPTPMPVLLVAGEALQDHHDTQFTRWFQMETKQVWHVDMIRRCVDTFARGHSFHPVRDYLDALKWDGVERLASWLFDFAGAGPAEGDENIDEKLMAFYSAAGERWMISAIARMRNPGCEVHHMLVLEGGEGLGKSTLVKAIGKGWAQVMTGSLDGKSAQELIASAVWIWEFSELASLKKTSEVEAAKAFITRPEEKFRPAYGRRVINHKRECAFIATVNGDQYLDSAAWEDGKRRVWPIRCTRPFDTEGLLANIDQLWAEADHKFKAGARWHFDRDEDTGLIETAKDEQLARVPESPLQEEADLAATNCAERAPGKWYGTASVAETLAEMKIPAERRDLLALRIGRLLLSAGWMAEQMRRANGRQVKRYRRPGDIAT